jgi:hypothetical protein
MALFAALLLGSSLLLWGCSESEGPVTPTPSPETGQVDLDAPHGGMAPTDEPPAFGDPDLAASEDREATFDDRMARDVHHGAWEMNPQARVFAFSARWGLLEAGEATGARVEDYPVQWDGRMETSFGSIRVMRLLDFEDDDEILPRMHRDLVEWISTTDGDTDGLRLILVFPPSPGRDSAEVHFQAGAVSRNFTLEELEQLSETIQMDDEGHGVELQSFRVTPAMDVRGFMAGRWVWSDEDSLGHFAGRWLSMGRHGNLRDTRLWGFVRGVYGWNSEGEKVFYGKIIDRGGRFQGFVEGTWEVVEETEAQRQGTFEGEWTDAEGRPMGTVQGRWHQHPDGFPGAFNGTWTRNE